MVISADGKCDGARIHQTVAAADFTARTIRHLINHRFGLEDFTTAQGQNQFTLRVDGNFVHATEMDLNHVRICARRNFKIVFKLLLVDVINQTNAGINSFHAYSGEGRHAGMP